MDSHAIHADFASIDLAVVIRIEPDAVAKRVVFQRAIVGGRSAVIIDTTCAGAFIRVHTGHGSPGHDDIVRSGICAGQDGRSRGNVHGNSEDNAGSCIR